MTGACPRVRAEDRRGVHRHEVNGAAQRCKHVAQGATCAPAHGPLEVPAPVPALCGESARTKTKTEFLNRHTKKEQSNPRPNRKKMAIESERSVELPRQRSIDGMHALRCNRLSFLCGAVSGQWPPKRSARRCARHRTASCAPNPPGSRRKRSLPGFRPRSRAPPAARGPRLIGLPSLPLPLLNTTRGPPSSLFFNRREGFSSPPSLSFLSL